VDIVTLALNMYSHGVDPKLNFENLPEIVKVYERLTKMRVGERQPYAGELVFTAFSGSHQDAIAKGMKWREEMNPPHWNVPYLPIDPKDIGREYEGDIIRINSQSGKGGIGYILQQSFGYDLPQAMRESVGYRVKDVSDKLQKELQPEEILKIFNETYVNVSEPYTFVNCQFSKNGDYHSKVTLKVNGETREITGDGNGRLDSVSNALQEELGITYSNLVYKQHALDIGSKSQAISYIGITAEDGTVFWGAGVDTDIITSSVKALFSAINRMVTRQ
jgi:2-isopropylmalate synthase